MEYKDIIIFILLTGVFIGIFYFVMEIKDEKIACVQNPFLYTTQIVKKSTGSELQCTCGFNDSNIGGFIYNRDGIINLNNNPRLNLNFSFPSKQIPSSQ